MLTRLWGNIWLRSLATLAYALGVQAVIAVAPRAIVLAESRRGTIDFAGGSIVHFSAWAAIAVLLPFWLGAEVVHGRRKMPPPMRLYGAFVVLFYLVMPVLYAWTLVAWFRLDLGYRSPAIWCLPAICLASAAVAGAGTAVLLSIWPVRAARVALDRHF